MTANPGTTVLISGVKLPTEEAQVLRTSCKSLPFTSVEFPRLKYKWRNKFLQPVDSRKLYQLFYFLFKIDDTNLYIRIESSSIRIESSSVQSKLTIRLESLTTIM